jgi:hypothetical protein
MKRLQQVPVTKAPAAGVGAVPIVAAAGAAPGAAPAAGGKVRRRRASDAPASVCRASKDALDLLRPDFLIP